MQGRFRGCRWGTAALWTLVRFYPVECTYTVLFVQYNCGNIVLLEITSFMKLLNIFNSTKVLEALVPTSPLLLLALVVPVVLRARVPGYQPA